MIGIVSIWSWQKWVGIKQALEKLESNSWVKGWHNILGNMGRFLRMVSVQLWIRRKIVGILGTRTFSIVIMEKQYNIN